MIRQTKKEIVLKNLSNIPGWRTRKKIVVLESDDWGSIRMSSVKTFNLLSKSGIDLVSDEGSRYNKFDSLATSTDLSSLFEVLGSVKDSEGQSAVITPVSIVANPDFEKIRKSDFSSYYYEPFVETLNRQQGCENSFSLWKEGIERRLFIPQFHGREHLNVKVWMRALLDANKKVRIAFDHGVWGISTVNDPDIKVELQAAFDFIDRGDLEYHREVILSGLDLFNEIFGYNATYFVPPNGPMNSSLEAICIQGGIKHLFRAKRFFEPLGNGKTRVRYTRPGFKMRKGLTYYTRNCFFEPGHTGYDWVDRCLSDISIAFKWNKPAVVSSHRVNYIGALHTENRANGLRQLEKLLRNIVKKWPDVVFLNSSELGELMRKDNENNF